MYNYDIRLSYNITEYNTIITEYIKNNKILNEDKHR